MTDDITREEAKEMIKDSGDAILATVEIGVAKAIDKKMNEYGIGPHHWVFLEAQYQRTMARRSIIQKTVITAIVTFVCAITAMGAKDWIYRVVIEHYEEEQRSD